MIFMTYESRNVKTAFWTLFVDIYGYIALTDITLYDMKITGKYGIIWGSYGPKSFRIRFERQPKSLDIDEIHDFTQFVGFHALKRFWSQCI